MKRLLVWVATGLVISACGSVAVGPGSNPTPSSGQRFDVAVSEKDTTATLRAGQKLEVVLHVYNGMTNWTAPMSSDESILAPITDSAATAARGVTLGAFLAKAPGVVNVSANSSPKCSPGQACPMYIAVFTLKVTVTS